MFLEFVAVFTENSNDDGNIITSNNNTDDKLVSYKLIFGTGSKLENNFVWKSVC